MTKYIWPTKGQTFAEATAHLIAKPKEKKKGRPVGSKNMEGHKAGRPPKTNAKRELRSVTLKNLDHSTSTMWLQGTEQPSLNV